MSDKALEDHDPQFTVRIDKLGRRVAAMSRHMRTVQRRFDDARASAPPGEQHAIEDLLAALHKLQVAQEELVAHHNEIGAGRLAVAQEHQRYLELFELAPDAYLVTGADGIIREANRAAAELLGVPQQLLSGQPLVSYVDDSSKRDLRSFISRFVHFCRDHEDAMKHEVPFLLRARASAALHASASAAPVRDRDSECVGLRWVLRDVSESERAQQALHQSNTVLERRISDRTAQLEVRTRELEVANDAKVEFLAVISHELRTPLQAVIGYADLMRSDIPGAMPAYAREWADHIHRAAEHVLTLIEQILSFSRLEAGQETLQLERVVLERLVREAVDFVEPAARVKGIDLTTKVSLDKNRQATTDPGKLRQILFNLLANAVKFTERGQVEIAVSEDVSRVAFQVSDTGIGIAPAQLERVFDHFWQAEHRPGRRKEGTGLGLSIARHLARLLGGEITVRSAVGAGSVFRLEIPVAMVAPEPTRPSRPGS